MIKTVTVTNYVGDSLEISMANPYISGLAITNIDGIASLDATINTTDVATNDGAVYNSARVNTRNIVLTLKPITTDTQIIEQGRLKIYKYFPVKKYLTLAFVTDTRHVQIHGYVESSEAEVFSELETVQISIICPNPYFEDFEPQIVDFFSVDNNFKFPFTGPKFDDIITLNNYLQYRKTPNNPKTDKSTYKNMTKEEWNLQLSAERAYNSATHNSTSRGLDPGSGELRPETFDPIYGTVNEEKLTWTGYGYASADALVWNLYRYVYNASESTAQEVIQEISNLTKIPLAKVSSLVANHASASLDDETSETGIVKFEMSNIFNSQIRVINYTGDIETGITLTIHTIGTVKNITLYNRSKRYGEDLREIMAITGTFEANEDIIITTLRNYKSAKLLKNGEYTNILNKISKNSDWFELQKGSNKITFMAGSGQDNMQVHVQTRVLYEGI